MDKKLQEKLKNNPYYRMPEVNTQEVRNDDVEVHAPIVRRKKNKPKVRYENEPSRDTVSTQELRPEVQEDVDVPKSDYES